jgi:glycosyltransferase involved in cell wall biosynthesis
MEKRAVCIISEDLSQPIDEGIKHFAYSLIKGCTGDCDVLGLSVRSPGSIDNSDTSSVKTNKLFLSLRLRAAIRSFRPDVICYVPSASATLFSFLRSRMLKLYWPAVRVVMVSLQPRQYNPVSQRLIRFLSPDMVFVQDEVAMKRLLGLGCHARLLPSGVDLKKFTPVSAEKKAELRSKYHLEPQTFTVLHVGHATTGRNIELLAQVQHKYHAQVVFVGSSLQHEDRHTLTSHLQGNGVVVLNEYFPNIEEIYQLADCYLFPVFSDRACIGVPLSVLEAMACNLPVVSVRYGNLPALFEEGRGLVYADTPEKLIQGIAAVRNYNGGCQTREKVTPYSWQRIARYVLETTANEENN